MPGGQPDLSEVHVILTESKLSQSDSFVNVFSRSQRIGLQVAIRSDNPVQVYSEIPVS